MASYYVNKTPQTNGDHEVHVANCVYIPGSSNREYLGEYSSCSPAVTEAKKKYPRANGCYFCCKPCHTS